MTRRKLSRNAPCPCGSGQKYKRCCWGKDFEYHEDDDGTIYKQVPLAGEVAELVSDQMAALRERLGREPEPEDLLFPEAPHAEHLEHELAEALRGADIDPALIYAFEKTGFLVTEENEGLFSDQDLRQWYQAIDEFREGYDDEVPEGPIGTIAYYGPDEVTTTKIVASVIVEPDAEPLMARWVGTNIREDQKAKDELDAFLGQHGVTEAGGFPFNIGCPHEEGSDFPPGEDCPFCPAWQGKQGADRWDRLLEKLAEWEAEQEG